MYVCIYICMYVYIYIYTWRKHHRTTTLVKHVSIFSGGCWSKTPKNPWWTPNIAGKWMSIPPINGIYRYWFVAFVDRYRSWFTHGFTKLETALSTRKQNRGWWETNPSHTSWLYGEYHENFNLLFLLATQPWLLQCQTDVAPKPWWELCRNCVLLWENPMDQSLPKVQKLVDDGRSEGRTCWVCTAVCLGNLYEFIVSGMLRSSRCTSRTSK